MSPGVQSKPPRPPPGAEGAERRRFERLELLAQVELRRGGDVALLPIVNISAGGVLLRCAPGDVFDVEAGEDVTVFLDISDNMTEPVSFTMAATVVRPQPTSIALMWSGSDASAVDQLGRLLRCLSAR